MAPRLDETNREKSVMILENQIISQENSEFQLQMLEVGSCHPLVTIPIQEVGFREVFSELENKSRPDHLKIKDSRSGKRWKRTVGKENMIADNVQMEEERSIVHFKRSWQLIDESD